MDLSNLFGGISELFDPGVYIDFSTLMPILDERFGGIDQYKVYGSYRGITETTKLGDIDSIKGQAEFMNSARLNGVYFGKGYVKNGQEKSVDMKLGIDMVNDAHNKEFTDYILFAGDADFSYPVSIIRDMGKYFHYCAFANRYSALFAFQARKKLVLDYNGMFVKNTSQDLIPPHDVTIVDIYKDKSVKTKSIKV